MLAGILVPTVGRALEQARRTTCRTNVRQIISACMLYTQTESEHRGRGTAQALPVAGFNPAQWYVSLTGNRANLWLLVAGGYCPPNMFVCPSLEGCTPALATAGGFGDGNCGFSYQSMVGPGGTRKAYGVLDTTSNMAVLADLNPRITVGSATLYQYEDFDHDGNTSAGEQARAAQLGEKARNSANHGYDGQNVGRLDGSAAWLDISRVVTNLNTLDWIYEADSTLGGIEADGLPGRNDVYLIP
jgi:hypothetical protein